MKFRKKPVVIEAVQFNGDAAALLEIDPQSTIKFQTDTSGPYAMIRTLEGVMVAGVGDWIIRGVKGELYPCKPDIFAATYDAVEERQTGTTPLVGTEYLQEGNML